MTHNQQQNRRKYWLASGMVLSAAAAAVGANWGKTRPGCLTGVPGYGYSTAVRSAIAFSVSSPALMLDSRNRVTALGLPAMAGATPPAVQIVVPAAPPAEQREVISTPAPLPFPIPAPAEELPAPASFRQLTGPQVAPGPILFGPPAAPPLMKPTAEQNFSKLFQWPTQAIVIEHCEIARPALQIHPTGEWTINLEARQNPGFDPAILKQGFTPTAHILRNRFQIMVRCYATTQAKDTVAVSGLGHACVAEIGPLDFMVERGEPLLLRRSGQWNCKCRHDQEAFARMDRAEIQFSFQR
jgi:hypothetical protein